ncbi:aminotransferase class III-fold pyridoxal phosphate-dependent enzyme [Streptomyces rhizosphaericus]|nr:aminotransferase class III-fold pyridoxal phosphate-dependent enzyme [Streptomyces rhizosphaericus]
MDDLMNCLTANSISTSRGSPITMATAEVRGTGLILGFELIEPKAKVPAVAATNAVLAQCRERGLLIGKGGLLGNVLRVTPLMTVTLHEARQALGMLDDVLARITPQAEPQADS